MSFEFDHENKLIVLSDFLKDDEIYENTNYRCLRRLYSDTILDLYDTYKNREGLIFLDDSDGDDFSDQYWASYSTLLENKIDSMDTRSINEVIAEYGVDFAYEQLIERGNGIEQDKSLSTQFIYVCLNSDITEKSDLVKEIIKIMLTDSKYNEYRIIYED